MIFLHVTSFIGVKHVRHVRLELLVGPKKSSRLQCVTGSSCFTSRHYWHPIVVYILCTRDTAKSLRDFARIAHICRRKLKDTAKMAQLISMGL